MHGQYPISKWSQVQIESNHIPVDNFIWPPIQNRTGYICYLRWCQIGDLGGHGVSIWFCIEGIQF